MIIAYKGFTKDLTDRMGNGQAKFQMHQWIEEREANCAKNGFHCARNPLDCLSYYPDMDNSIYCIVVADGDIDEDGYGTRIACTKLKPVKELDLKGFVIHSMQYVAEHPEVRSSYIADGIGMVKNKFLLVRGRNPIGRGKPGDVLGFLVEGENGSIAELGIAIIAERTCNKYLDINGNIVSGTIK